MAFSVNTNVGAMAALQSLTSTQKDLATTQSRINTGMAVSSTKDDSAQYTIAQGLRGDLGGLKAVSSSLSRAKSVTDVAVAGAEQISDIVNQMKAKATQAADAGIDTATRDALNKDFTALRDQISTIVNASDFNGTNLLKASGGTVTALQSLQDSDTSSATTWNPDSLSVANQGLDLGGSTITVASTGQINTQAAAQTMVDTLTATQANLKTTLSTLGAASRKIDAQSTFTSKLSDVIDGGIGNLVDADLAKESARLQALQVKQQLGVQALSIANQAPQTITSLFR
ncbi:Flagellin [Sphingomonas sp. S2M10]|uniref:flagellin n=1 Tax=Sphingomonas sp. S2M10 TaxID=2705010 RepID=UPI0014569C99|nr:flagellin [Sphingomonas sp. S2M10]NLS27290.1 Flagellin [Sphingomonas sp. S2M10]